MKVSVSVTTYGHERYIARALDGILMQETPFDFEVVVGDDLSTDRTRDVVLAYRDRHPDRIRTVFPERNLGGGGKLMFVETVRACRGEYVAMLDGDDYWTAPDKLRRQAEFLDAHRECSLVFHDALRVREDGSAPPERYVPPGHPQFSGVEELLLSNFIPSPSPMVRREVMAEFPAWFFASPWGDYPLYFMAAERGLLGYVDEVMAVYRVHPAGLWSRLDAVAQARSSVAFYDTLPAEMRARHRGTLARVLARRHYAVARAHAECGQVAATARHLWTSLRADPRSAKVGHLQLLRMLLRACTARLSRGSPS